MEVGGVYVRWEVDIGRRADGDGLDQVEVRHIVSPPTVKDARCLGPAKPGVAEIHINDVIGAVCFDLADEFLLHLGRVRVGFYQRIHVYIAGGRAAVGVKIDLRLRAEDGDAR